HQKIISFPTRRSSDLKEQIKNYIAAQPEPKINEMKELHQMILALMPKCRLWFLDGKDDKGKTVSNPNIGYGFRIIKYADGKTKEDRKSTRLNSSHVKI